MNDGNNPTAPTPEQMRALAAATTRNLSAEQRRERMFPCSPGPFLTLRRSAELGDPYEVQNWRNER